ncbi:hypothetical protein COCSUDRAFT_33979 [Coccomyxa subellipsoidea C-169]|uniref:Uncharacterized protein n=1 Tax=Coccomyxa subellipsoidea (strain C-169) TaxID=574566 RepID=I0YPZ8_COCSC|nr:hypothetical protein COCSUDRAFT_33979 [Coccomyxa subellipsoidea C-169]EIE20467.1 hypothetical protein COCSUDRAFT_33979 [Coccomyxa subellipsoidea C-169]|eukprot:XP_005645011.1 hypothetical protein COCSUDRAFT_33979 [Coccomyxa subellipsoidea C-169]
MPAEDSVRAAQEKPCQGSSALIDAYAALIDACMSSHGSINTRLSPCFRPAQCWFRLLGGSRRPLRAACKCGG